MPSAHLGLRLEHALDEPLHDGFGVVIVTVAIRGDARVLLRVRPWDELTRCEKWFSLRAGEAYVLSGDARVLLPGG